MSLSPRLRARRAPRAVFVMVLLRLRLADILKGQRPSMLFTERSLYRVRFKKYCLLADLVGLAPAD